jgi:multidrug efflux pump subunit AcrA (membrane-fusion protein)
LSGFAITARVPSQVLDLHIEGHHRTLRYWNPQTSSYLLSDRRIAELATEEATEVREELDAANERLDTVTEQLDAARKAAERAAQRCLRMGELGLRLQTGTASPEEIAEFQRLIQESQQP